MLLPAISQGMKKLDYLASNRVFADKLVGLVKAAVGALKDEVIDVSCAAFAPGNDVVDVKYRDLSDLRKATISAATAVA